MFFKTTVSRFMWFFLVGIVSSAISSDIPTYICKLKTGTVNIDGVLNESVWQTADTAKMKINNGGGVPTDETNVFATWDSLNLYLGFIAMDKEINGEISTDDGRLWDEEPVEMFIDPDGDQINYFEFQWNNCNAMYTGFKRNFSLSGDIGWNPAGVKHAVTVHGTANNSADVDTSIVVEVKIPWSDLAFADSGVTATIPKANDTIRINFYRYSRTKATWNDYELNSWSDTEDGSFHIPERFGKMVLQGNTGISDRTKTNYNKGISLSIGSAYLSNGNVVVSYSLPNRTNVKVEVLDIFGKKVKTLFNNSKNSGNYSIYWNKTNANGQKVSKGIYLIMFEADGIIKAGKINVR